MEMSGASLSVQCRFCHQNVSTRDDLLIIVQFYPNFPVATYHNDCYAKFLKSGNVYVGPYPQVVLNGAKSKWSLVFASAFFVFWILILLVAVRPSLSDAGIVVRSVFYLILLVGAVSILGLFVLLAHARAIEQRLPK